MNQQLTDRLDEAVQHLQEDHESLHHYAVTMSEASDRIQGLQQAIITVCEGWNLPDDARKVLETELWKGLT